MSHLLKPQTNLKRMSDRTLGRFLYDAFDRHTPSLECARMNEIDHAMAMKDHIEPELRAHMANMTVSQEMWCVAILINQFRRAANPTLQVPSGLMPFSERIYNNPVFRDTFSELRETMRNANATPKLQAA